MPLKLLSYTSAFAAGFAVLSLEVLGFRLLAPTFGYSIYVFGALVGVILLALSIGYLVGGYLGDRGTTPQRFGLLLLLSAAYLAAVAVFYPSVLDALENFSTTTGALLATLVLLAVPMVVFASLSPYVVKLTAAQGHLGRTAGRTYAVGTLGSLAGTFLTSFWLVPVLGASTTLRINVALAALLAVAWLLSTGTVKPAVVGVLIAALVPFAPGQGAAGNVLTAVDSPYSRLEVVDYGSLLGLRTDQSSGVVYSFYPKQGWPYGTSLYDYFAVAPLINDADNALLLGLGAGSIPLLHEQVNPNLRITGVEIDADVVELGRRFFGLEQRRNTRVVIDDARPFLREDESTYDLVELDLFRGGTEVPFYLATREFFTLAADHLNDGGLLAMNVYDPSPDQVLLRPVLETVASVLPSTYHLDLEGGSHFVVAARTPLKLERLRGRQLEPDLARTVEKFQRELKRFESTEGRRVLTDDAAPLEQLTHAALGR